MFLRRLAQPSRLFFAIALLAALALTTLTPLPPASAAPIAYSVRSDVDDQLYQIDLATGVATAIGPVGFVDVEGLAFNCAGGLYGVDDATDQLISINLATGAGTVVGPLGIGGVGTSNDFGLTFDTAGNLWLSTDLPGNFYSVNPATGAATLVGAQGQAVTGLAFNGATGILYGLGGDGANNLVTLNTATGAATNVGPLGAVALVSGGIDFDVGGVLWGLNEFSAGGVSQIFTINTATGAATVVSTVSLAGAPIFGFEGLAISTPCTSTPTPTATSTTTPTATATGPTPTPTSTPLPPPPAPTDPPPPPPPVLVDPLITKAVNLMFAQVGDPVLFTIVVTNPNPVPLFNVVVTDTLPPQLDFVSAIASQGTFTVDAGTNIVTFDVGTLGAGGSATLTIEARVNQQGQPGDILRNIARLNVGGQAEASLQIVPPVIPVTGNGPGWRETAPMVMLALLIVLGLGAAGSRVRHR